jgi:hypothetical protein
MQIQPIAEKSSDTRKIAPVCPCHHCRAIKKLFMITWGSPATGWSVAGAPPAPPSPRLRHRRPRRIAIRVKVNGDPAPLLYASDTLVTYQCPMLPAGQTLSVIPGKGNGRRDRDAKAAAGMGNACLVLARHLRPGPGRCPHRRIDCFRDAACRRSPESPDAERRVPRGLRQRPAGDCGRSSGRPPYAARHTDRGDEQGPHRSRCNQATVAIAPTPNTAPTEP